MPATNTRTDRGGYESPINYNVPVEGSSWIAVWVFEHRQGDRIRFAHSSPVHIEIPGKPLQPRRQEVEYLVQRMKQELARNEQTLRPVSLKEYRDALRKYEQFAREAK